MSSGGRSACTGAILPVERRDRPTGTLGGRSGRSNVIVERDGVSGSGSEVGGFVAGEPPLPAVSVPAGGAPVLPVKPDVLLELDEVKPEPRWPIAWFAFAAVFALTGATALILPHLAPIFGAGGGAASVGSPGMVGCVVDRRDPGYCARYAKDVASRAALTDEERRLMGSATRRLDKVLRGAHPSPGQAPVDALQAVLDGAGYPGSVVRVARPDDPAPVGSLLFAVPLGSDCVVGHLHMVAGGGAAVLVGQLPDGSCLSE